MTLPMVGAGGFEPPTRDVLRVYIGDGESTDTKVEGRWEVVMDAGTRADGSRKQIRRRFPTRRAAEDFRTKTLNEVRSGSYVEPSRELFGAYFARWILDRRGSLKPASVYVLKNVQTRLRVLDRVEIGEITPALVQRLVVTMQDAQYAATTVNKTFSVLKQCLRDAVAFRLIPDNPCDRVHTPKVPTLNPKSFTTAEVTRFREAVAGTERHALWETAIETGLRQGELAALRISSVDLERRVIHVRETLSRTEDGRPSLGTPKRTRGCGPLRSRRRWRNCCGLRWS
jgi:integrase